MKRQWAMRLRAARNTAPATQTATAAISKTGITCAARDKVPGSATAMSVSGAGVQAATTGGGAVTMISGSSGAGMSAAASPAGAKSRFSIDNCVCSGGRKKRAAGIAQSR